MHSTKFSPGSSTLVCTMNMHAVFIENRKTTILIFIAHSCHIATINYSNVKNATEYNLG